MRDEMEKEPVSCWRFTWRLVVAAGAVAALLSYATTTQPTAVARAVIVSNQ